MSRYISRKFLVVLGALGSAHWLCANGLIADGVYSAVVIAALATYMTANVAQKATAKDSNANP